jgi:hypothetical protein
MLQGIAEHGDGGDAPGQHIGQQRAEVARIAPEPVKLLPGEAHQFIPLMARYTVLLRERPANEPAQRCAGCLGDVQEVDPPVWRGHLARRHPPMPT